jgi:hypothetical protein
MPAPMRSWLSMSLSAALLCGGCSTSRLADSSDTSPTLVKLSPDTFRGEVPCLPGDVGALQAYSVNLFVVDREQDGGVASEELVASSPAVSCRSAVSFQATSERLYVADIVGYDQVPAPGVEPRWAASCGRGPDGAGPALIDVGSNDFGATRASLNITVPMVGCTYLRELTPRTTEASVIVSLGAALGDLECGASPGQVSDFVAVLDGQSQAASCTGQVSFSDVPLGTELRIRVSAFSGGGGPVSDAGTPGDASAGPLDAAASVVDAGDGGADAAPVDASTPVGTPSPSDAGLDGSVATPGRVPQWTTVCLARAYAGVATRAECEPLQAVSN